MSEFDMRAVDLAAAGLVRRVRECGAYLLVWNDDTVVIHRPNAVPRELRMSVFAHSREIADLIRRAHGMEGT